MTTPRDDTVTVYWRPGCPYCSRLLGDLERIGLPTHRVNIWESTTAAARVRKVAGGNETVPTVMIGEHAMINPRATDVVEVVRTRSPGLLDELDPDSIAKITRGPWRPGLAFAVLMAVIWIALAIGSPTTTYHFAPVIIAAAWPVGQRLRTGKAISGPRSLMTALGGSLLALTATALLAARGALAGPALFGLPGAPTETLAGIAVGAFAGAGLAVVRREPVESASSPN